MSKLHYDQDASLDQFADRTVAIIGYGSQGHAHALNLRDSGLKVVVGLRPNSASWPAAAAELPVTTVAQAVEEADLVMMLAPDTAQQEIYGEHVEPNLTAGKTLLFAHGFNIRYGLITPPETVDVAMVAPKSPGHRVRELYLEGAGTPALLAVHQDATGQAHATALGYAKALGCTRAGVLETTFAEETETDLFGEQAVLCGGVSALVRAGFETLVEAGYQPEVAYFECMHELKLIVDLMYRGGLSFMWHSVSDTAEHGGYEAGARVVDEAVRARMRDILHDVQDGSYANRWIHEDREGRQRFDRRRATEHRHPMEQVGQRLRSMMGFLDTPGSKAPVSSVT